MKPVYFILTTFLFYFHFSNAQNIHFPDANFKSALISAGVDANNDGEISQEEAQDETTLLLVNKSIHDLTGIKYFTNVLLLIALNNSIPTLDLSGLSNLGILIYQNNSTSRINLDGLSGLTSLDCSNNALSFLNARGLINLESLYGNNNDLKSIDIRNTPKLASIQASNNCSLECIIVDDQVPQFRSYLVSGCINLNNVITEAPCLTTFEGLPILVEAMGIHPATEAVLLSSIRLAEESCSLGSKKVAISTLQTLKLMVYRSEHQGRLSIRQADELIESINILIEDINNGTIDCSREEKNILDWFDTWFSLENGPDTDVSNPQGTATATTLYPNPTSGRVNFSQPDQQVVVYNMLGKVMEKAEGVNHVDLSDYQPGVYVIQLEKGGNRTMHQVVKQ